MSITALFPTKIFQGAIDGADVRALNKTLLDDIRKLERSDAAGRKWCETRYPDGYTSFASANDLQLRYESFKDLRRRIDKKVTQYSRALNFDYGGGSLEMLSCWVNVMRPKAHHDAHLHPGNSLSGTYYVQGDSKSGALVLEDPVASLKAGGPGSGGGTAVSDRLEYSILPKPGQLVLFESWLRHSVTPYHGKPDRVSISFNYEWLR